MNLQELPHRLIQTSSKLTYKDFDEEIKQMIVDFEGEYSEYLNEAPDKEKFKALVEKSNNIGEYIYINYVLHNDTMEYTVEELEEDNDKMDDIIKALANSAPLMKDNYQPEGRCETALHKLWTDDIRVDITKKILEQYGFNLGFTTPLGKYGCTCGRYRLKRENSDDGFKLSIVKK